MMIGGDRETVGYLDPIFQSFAPRAGDIPRMLGREKKTGTTEQGYRYCGPSGAGHFVKMVHNGIEYGRRPLDHHGGHRRGRQKSCRRLCTRDSVQFSLR